MRRSHETLSRKDFKKKSIHTYRTSRSHCHHCHSGGNAAAGIEQGKNESTRHFLRG